MGLEQAPVSGRDPDGVVDDNTVKKMASTLVCLPQTRQLITQHLKDLNQGAMHCPVGLQTLHLPVGSRPHQPASPSAYNVSAHTHTVPTTPLYAALPHCCRSRSDIHGCTLPAAMCMGLTSGGRRAERQTNREHAPFVVRWVAALESM